MKALFANVLALLLFTVTAVEVRAADIAVVISSDANVYQEAMDGFREQYRHRIVSVRGTERMLETVVTPVTGSLRLPCTMLYGCR